MKPELFALLAILATGTTAAPNASSKPAPVVLTPTNPLLHKHGRWDSAPGTWYVIQATLWVAQGLILADVGGRDPVSSLLRRA